MDIKSYGEVIVEAENLTKVFRDFWRRPKKLAVDGVSLSIRRGEVFGLLGPNGSGKSTTIKMLLGLLRPTAGRVSLFGLDPACPVAKARLGYLPELSHFHKYLTPRETLHYYAGLFNMPIALGRERAAALLERMGIASSADREIGEFSKGMARRVGLAQALLNDPDLVILDEPTSGLDPIGRHDVKNLIKELAGNGKTVLLSSHLLAEVEDVCDRVAILCNGRVGAAGSLADLLERREQVRLTVGGLSDEDLTKLKGEIERQGATVSVDHPAMTLEEYFLATIERDSAS